MQIQWKPEYNIHIPSIDAQHQTLVELMNQLALAIEDKKHNLIVTPQLIQIADKLALYVNTHFAAEEKLFKQYAINAVHHLSLHDEFRARLSTNQAYLSDGASDLTHLLTVHKELFMWFINHIKTEDQEIFKFLIEN